MKMDWKCIVVIVLALVLSASLLAPLAAARGAGGAGGRAGGIGGGFGGAGFAGDAGRGFDRGGGFDGIGGRGVAWHDADWARWHGHWNYWGGGVGVFPLYGYGYTAFTPVSYGGNQGACYQACVTSGQYTPQQCGQMCYYA